MDWEAHDWALIDYLETKPRTHKELLWHIDCLMLDIELELRELARTKNIIRLFTSILDCLAWHVKTMFRTLVYK